MAVVEVVPEVVLSPRPSSSWSSTGAARKAVDGHTADVGERVEVVENLICVKCYKNFGPFYTR